MTVQDPATKRLRLTARRGLGPRPRAVWGWLGASPADATTVRRFAIDSLHTRVSRRLLAWEKIASTRRRLRRQRPVARLLEVPRQRFDVVNRQRRLRARNAGERKFLLKR